MPNAAPRTCTYPGCRTICLGSRCEKHPAQPWMKHGPQPKRITGRRLQRMRKNLIAQDPLCAECRKEGRVTAGTQRDHVISLKEGGADDSTNEQMLCDAHHDAKTHRESMRGRGSVKL